MMAEEEQQPEEPRRNVPQSDLDFNLMTTDPEWGRNTVDQDFQSWLTLILKTKNEDGKEEVFKKNLWGRLNFYRRDMRLANLDKEEIFYVQYYLDLAGDFLASDMIEPFLICLSRGATVLELSQSKKGFLRRRMNTFTKENFNQELGPPQKKLLGGYKEGV